MKQFTALALALVLTASTASSMGMSNPATAPTYYPCGADTVSGYCGAPKPAPKPAPKS